MRIKDLFLYENDLLLNKDLDIEKELEVCSDINAVKDNSLLFFPKPIGSLEYRLPRLRQYPYAVVTDSNELSVTEEIPTVRMKNARRALAFAYSHLYGIDYNKLKIVGITGTNGKTSTATMLENILLKSGRSTGYIGTGSIRINGEVISQSDYSMTTPDPSVLYQSLARMQEAGCEYAVMEVSSHALAQSRCAPIRFALGIFTNLAEDHMDYHKTKEDYYRAKLSLFESCDMGVFNIDDEYGERAYNSAKCRKYSIGIINEADASITALKDYGLLGSEYFYRECGIIFKERLKLGGSYNIYNALSASKAAIALGVPAVAVKNALCKLKKIDGRLELVSNSPYIIIDYAHTAEAFDNLLKLLESNKKQKQNITVVFGCGGDRDTTKREKMGAVAAKYAQKIILTEDNSRSESFDNIRDGILLGIMDKSKVTVIENRAVAIEEAIINAHPDDIIAIVGKGHERYIIDALGKHPFDEREIIYKALAKRRENENKA